MRHCGCFQPAPISRREMLARCGGGFGAVALAALLNDVAIARPVASVPFATKIPQYPAKVRSVIFLYMDGGVSQVDTFDPKPRLDREHGQPFEMKIEPTQFNNNGNTFGSPVEVPRSTAQSGIPVSDLFPHVAECVDDLAVIRSMTSEFSEHTVGQLFPAHRARHAGPAEHGRVGQLWPGQRVPANLPGFVVLNGGLIPPGGLDNFNSGFLPATYQGSIFKPRDRAGRQHQAAREPEPELQRNKLALLKPLDVEAARTARAGRRARVGHRQLRAGLPHADGRSRS